MNLREELDIADPEQIRVTIENERVYFTASDDSYMSIPRVHLLECVNRLLVWEQEQP